MTTSPTPPLAPNTPALHAWLDSLAERATLEVGNSTTLLGAGLVSGETLAAYGPIRAFGRAYLGSFSVTHQRPFTCG